MRTLTPGNGAGVRVATPPAAAYACRGRQGGCRPVYPADMATPSDVDERAAKASVRVLMETGLANNHSQALREQVAVEVPRYLAENGSRISFHHWLSGDRAGVGFGLITEMTADLAKGAGQLFAAELFYPGAALVRQLLECGYLLALAGEHKDEMATWLDGSADEISSMFKPRKMRDRSARGFRFGEYRVHCERGGHPHRDGQDLLRGHRSRDALSTRTHWVDLAQHLAEIWDFFCAALPLYEPRMLRDSGVYRPDDAPEGGHQVALLIDEWRRQDPLAERFAAS